MISHGGISKRYATALFSSALQREVVGEVQEDIRQFKRLLDEIPVFNNFLLSPQILTEDKINLIRKALARKANDIFIRFLELLIRKERFEFAQEIADAFIELYERYMGILKVRVTTAVGLDEGTERRLKATLEKQTHKKIVLTKKVDPEIVAGMVIKMEDKIIDGSAKFQLSRIRKKLKEVKVY